MYKQLDVFDFIGWPESQKTMFEQIFQKVQEPVSKCANCLCQYCTHNVEELYKTVKVNEVDDPPCFNCDECRTYSGDCTQKEQAKEDCQMFIISEYGAKKNRKRIKRLGGVK